MKRFSVLLTLCLCSLPGFRPVFAAEPVATASQPTAAASCPYVLDRNNSRSQAGLESDIDLYSLLPERPVFRRMPRPDCIAGGTLLDIREQELQTAHRLRDIILSDASPAILQTAGVPGPVNAPHPADLPVLHDELPAAVVATEGPAAPALVESAPVAEEALVVQEAPVAETVIETVEETVVESAAISLPAADLPTREPVVAPRPELPVIVEAPVAVELPVEVADLPAREPVVAPRPELPVVVEAPVAVELPTIELPVVELPVEVADLPVREPVVAPRPELPVVVEAPVAIELPVVELPVVELPVVELPVVELPVVELPVVELPVVELPVEVADLPAREPVVAPRPELPAVVEEAVIEEVVSVAIETRQPASLEAAADTSEFGYPLSFDFLVQMPLPLPAAEPVVEIVVDTLDDVSIATDAESIAVTTVETTEETSTELDDPAGIDDAIEYVDSAASVQSEVSAPIPVASPEDLDLNLDFGFEQLPAVQVDSIETQNVGTTDEEIELEQSPRAEDATIDQVEENELRQDAAANLQIPTDEPVEEDEFELFYGLGAPSPADG